MTMPLPVSQSEHNRQTRDAYDRLAAVWAATTDDGPFNGLLERYVRDWSVPLRSFATALRPGGWAVISLDHPFGPRLPSQHGGYFDTELVTDTWRKADVEVSQRFWKRPLSAVADAFADAGFVIDRIAEPQPSPQALDRYPADLAGIAGVPVFIVYRLKLLAG